MKKAGTTNEIPSDSKKGSAATLCASGVTGIDINGDVIKDTSSSSSTVDQKVTGTSTTPAREDKVCGKCSPPTQRALSKVKENEDIESRNNEQCAITETVAMVRISYYDCHYTHISRCNLCVLIE